MSQNSPASTAAAAVPGLVGHQVCPECNGEIKSYVSNTTLNVPGRCFYKRERASKEPSRGMQISASGKGDYANYISVFMPGAGATAYEHLDHLLKIVILIGVWNLTVQVYK